MSEESTEDTQTSPKLADQQETPPLADFENGENQSITTGVQATLEGPSLASVIDVPLRITVEIGKTRMLVREVLQLNKGSVVSLDRTSGDPADILVNGRLIARGEITTIDDSLAVRIVELVTQKQNGGER